MTAVFEELAADDGLRPTWEYFAARPVPVSHRFAYQSELHPDRPITVQSDARDLMRLVNTWGRDLDDETERERAREYAMDLLSALHDMEVERAAQPPVINVTVTPPAGVPGMPAGNYQVQTGPQPTVSFWPAQARLDDTSTDMPVYRPPQRRGLRLLRGLFRAKG